MSKLRSKIAQRPAESSTFVAALAAFVASLRIDLSPDQWRGIVAALGLVAAVATYLRVHGGIRSIVRGLWSGDG